MEHSKEDRFQLSEDLCKVKAERDELRETKVDLFTSNMRLVGYVSNKFTPTDNSIDYEDILQEGYLGLWKACLTFDESKGFTFSTYAVSMIRGQILRMLRDTGALHIPRSFKDIRSALKSHGFTLPLTDSEIDVLVSEGKFSRYQIMSYSEPEVVSLNTPFGQLTDNDDSETEFASIIPDEGTDILNNISEDLLEDTIDSILQYIKPEHRNLVEEWIYSTIIENKPISQRELSIKYKISQPQVSKIIKSATEIFRFHKKDIINVVTT